MRTGDAGQAVRARARLVERLRAQGFRDERVLGAMQSVPRHMFVDEGLAYSAYDDTPLPIGFQQTISQPFIVARMIELLRAGRELGRTLEVGAGCGYQAAVLSQLATEVYAVERIRPLLDRARANFLETFVFFAAAVLAVVVAGKSSPTTLLGAQIYFWARLAYVPVYAFGVPMLRTVVWGASMVGLVMVLVGLLR